MMTANDTPSLIDDIKELLFTTAEKTGIKKTKRKHLNPDPPWFNEECKTLKRKISNYGRILRNKPDSMSTRQNLYIEKKKLRNLIKKNKDYTKNQ